MVKRIRYILLACILPIAQTGLMAHVHLCDNNITAISFFEHENDPCACEDFGSTDCCNDLIIKSKIAVEATNLVKTIPANAKFGIPVFFVEPNFSFWNYIVFKNTFVNKTKDRCCFTLQITKIINTTFLRN